MSDLQILLDTANAIAFELMIVDGLLVMILLVITWRKFN